MENTDVGGVKRINPIKVKGEPDHTHVTIDLTEEAAALPQSMVKLETRNLTDCMSYDKTENEVDDYLPDDTLIPMETDSSQAENFEDKNINCVDVNKIQDMLIKLVNSFQFGRSLY